MLQLGKETTVEFAGKRWRVGRLTRGVIRKFRDWIAAEEGDVFALADRFLDKVDKTEGLALLKEAKEKRDQLQAFSLDCPLAKRYLNTELGAAQLFAFLLEVNHPDASLDNGFDMLMELGKDQAARVLKDAAGEVPEKNAVRA